MTNPIHLILTMASSPSSYVQQALQEPLLPHQWAQEEFHPWDHDPAELHTTTLIASLHLLLHCLRYFNDHVICTIYILHSLNHLHCVNDVTVY